MTALAGSLFGPWVERLEAIAVGRERIAVGGRRDVAGRAASYVHVVATTIVDGQGAAVSIEAGGAIRALAFAGDDLLIGGGDDGALIAWDVAGGKPVASLALGAGVRAIALDAGAARGDAGVIAVGTADGALHLVAFAIQRATPTFGAPARRALSDGAIGAVACDPAGLWLAGGADGQLWIVAGESARAVAPGGDGGIRAIACLGDGRAAIGCGDGSVRLCFVVGDVEAVDRSGDHGHQAAVRALVLGPQITDASGRDAARRLFSVGDDGALKAWFVDGNRRPRTIELGLGPASALGFAPGPVAKLDGAIGRLWIASTDRKLGALALGAEADPAGDPVVIGSALDQLAAQLRDARAAVKVKLAAVHGLAGLAEDEARALLDLALASGPSEVRIATPDAMVRSERKASRPALRAALSAEPAELRAAAFAALVALERDQ
ncbi:MAG TPA: hypothetical protein VFP84_23050, partial [Kofleriaceae bacterium]|nr:hypothetical protein [Kofleriaceae bacterium]